MVRRDTVNEKGVKIRFLTASSDSVFIPRARGMENRNETDEMS